MNFVIFNNCELAVITFVRYLEGTHLLFRDQNVAHWLDVLALPLVLWVGWGTSPELYYMCTHVQGENPHASCLCMLANTLSVKPCPCRVFEPMFEFLNVSLKSETCVDLTTLTCLNFQTYISSLDCSLKFSYETYISEFETHFLEFWNNIPLKNFAANSAPYPLVPSRDTSMDGTITCSYSSRSKADSLSPVCTPDCLHFWFLLRTLVSVMNHRTSCMWIVQTRYSYFFPYIRS